MSLPHIRERFGIPGFALWSSLAAMLTLLVTTVSAQSTADKPFTVVDEIALAHFGDPYGGEAEALQFSPDGRYIAALIERGRIDLNRPEDTLRIYRVQDMRKALRRANGQEPPEPLWAFDRSTDKDGPIITHWRWLRDSSGIAFLERAAHGCNRLMLADLRKRTIQPLTEEGQAVKAFDISDRQHYVYAVADRGLLQRAAAESKAAAFVGTGQTLDDLLFPVTEDSQKAPWTDRSELWAVVGGGEPFRVKDGSNDQDLLLFEEGLTDLALSPDGQSVVTALAVAEIPSAWEQLYPPPFAAYPLHLRAGKEDLATFMGYRLVSRYGHVDLHTGRVRWLADGPTGAAAGWPAGASPAWSEDGKSIVLPTAFVAPDAYGRAHACVAVVNVGTPIPFCVEAIEGPNKSGSYEKSRFVTGVRFADAHGQRLLVSHSASDDSRRSSTEYRRIAAGAWAKARQSGDADLTVNGNLTVTVRQGLNDPPVLTASALTSRGSRVIWDPNPQLKDVALGEATVYRWKDKAGRDWKGGLFKPVPYEVGRRYPLVIQTHGFSETEFRPSGIFPTAFAARALAGAGLVVLQAPDCPIYQTPEEGPCNVEGYEAAASQLINEGLVDSARIGIIGFSRTCFYVMETLTTGALQIKAASVTDGVMGDYLQYMTSVDVPGFADDADATIGARPFADGLQRWLKRSPLFNMEKVSAALQVVAEGRRDLTFMWGPYAAMRYMQNPVDLVLLNNNEHVLSNPAARLVSQGGSVDWFRFWLQDYEDPDPAKAEQYRRWEGLCDMQVAQNPKQRAFCVRSNTH